MSIKTDAIVIRDETIAGANTATRVGTNLSDIADDLVAKQAAIDLKQDKPLEGAFVDGDKTKLDGITAGATPDQVLPEILVSDGLGSSVQAALDSAEAQAGVPVRITEDIPALDFPILMDSNQTLIFEGVTIFVKNGITGGTAIGGADPLGYWNSHAVIKNRQGGGTSTNPVVRDYLRGNSIEGGETNITVIGGTIDGSNIPDDVGDVGIEFVYNGVQLHNVTNSRVENVTFQSVLRRSGIEQGNVDVRNSFNVIVKNINATDTWYSGTYVMDGSHITIDGGYIHQTGDSGIIAVNSDYGVIQNVYVDDCGQKPDGSGASNITSNMRFGKFINNKSINAGLYLSTRGGSINAYGFTLGHPDGFSAYNSIVSGNHFEGNASKGIFLQGAGTVNNIVSNNILIDNGNLNPAINTGGINLQGVGSNKVFGNTCIGNYNGIVLSNLTADSIIESNTIVDSTLYGINLDSATNTITKLNDITNSGTSDYRDNATGSTFVSFEGGNLTADNLSGTNTGDVTLTTTGSGAATLVGQALNIPISGSGSVDDTAYAVSWNGVTTVAPSKNALYDFIESQVFKVDATSNIIPIFWGGTQAEYDIDFPSGHPANYFVVITDGAVTPTSASDIVNVPSGNLVATDVQAALNEIQTEVDGLSGGGLIEGDIDTLAKLNAIVTDATLIDTGDVPITAVDFDPVGTDNSTNVTLTTIGTSGAATLVGQALNIPEYSGGGGATIITQEEGVEVDAVATTLNFIGAGVTATDAGAGVTNITIAGGSIDLTSDLVLSTPTATASELGTEWVFGGNPYKVWMSGTNSTASLNWDLNGTVRGLTLGGGGAGIVPTSDKLIDLGRTDLRFDTGWFDDIEVTTGYKVTGASNGDVLTHGGYVTNNFLSAPSVFRTAGSIASNANHANGTILFTTSGSALTYTIDQSGMAVGSRILIKNRGVLSVTVVAGTGVTYNGSAVLVAGESVWLVQSQTDDWD